MSSTARQVGKQSVNWQIFRPDNAQFAGQRWLEVKAGSTQANLRQSSARR